MPLALGEPSESPRRAAGIEAKLWRYGGTRKARSFSIYIDPQPLDGCEKEIREVSGEAASLLLGLPWELLNNGRGYLFQGAHPVQVRRRLPNRESSGCLMAEPPIRTLLVSPRPEDKSAGYFNHRSSALPLVTALEKLGRLVSLTILRPPTFPAMEEEIQRAAEAGEPYHIVHFDGHGIYSRELGLSGLCFEEPEDRKKVGKRRSKIVKAEEIAAVIIGNLKFEI
ncbi:MAG: hypothetical protein GY757_43925 [bacterium]|nr:hypothetical protein [bacterium]